MANTNIMQINSASEYYEFKNQLHKLVLKKYYNRGGNYVQKILTQRIRRIMKRTPEFFGTQYWTAVQEYGTV